MQVPPSPQAAAVFLSVEKSPFKGDKNAKVTIIEFSDYQCPFCARHNRETLPQLTNAYIKTGKVKYVFRDFPLESIHQQALKAHEAAYCAGEQGKFWQYHDQLFANQGGFAFTHFKLEQYARALELNSANFKRCLTSEKYRKKVEGETAIAASLGARGTPTCFVNGRLVVGAQPFKVFQNVINEELKSKKKQ